MILFTFDTPEECDKFVRLYEKYGGLSLFTIRQLIQNQYTAEDLLQEIFLIIAKNLDKIDETDSKRTRNYIITVSRNYCKSYLRKRNREKEDLIEDPSLFISSKENDDFLNLLLRQETLRFLIQEVDALDDKYKIPLELKVVNGLSDEQIAKIMGIKKKNVQMRLYRARLLLHNKLKEL